MKGRVQYEGDVCATCKRFSATTSTRSKGYCLKLRKYRKGCDTCGYYKPDIKVEYQMECGAPQKPINTMMPSKFHN